MIDVACRAVPHDHTKTTLSNFTKGFLVDTAFGVQQFTQFVSRHLKIKANKWIIFLNAIYMAFSSNMSTMLCGIAIALIAILTVVVLLRTKIERFDTPPSDVELNIAIVKAYNDTLHRFPATEELTKALAWTKSTLPATTLTDSTALAAALAAYVSPSPVSSPATAVSSRATAVSSNATPSAVQSVAQPMFSPVDFGSNTTAAPPNAISPGTIQDLKRQIDGVYATIQKIENKGL